MNGVPLNVFQKTQRIWDTQHPYNAAQAMELSRRFSKDELESAFNAALEDLRLGPFVCRGGSYWIDRSARKAVTIVEVPDFMAHVTGEMNRAFDSEISMPLRPFVCNAGESQIVGLSYQHWVADSVSIRTIMRAWLARLLGDASLRPPPALLDKCGFRRRFGWDVARWSVVANFAQYLPFMRMLKGLRRLETHGEHQQVAVIHRVLEGNLIGNLRRSARSHGVTVGDVFLAAAAEACAAYGPNTVTPKRSGLAMGTIVDIRGRGRRVPDRVFGLYLGFMINPYSRSDVQDFDHLIHRTRHLRHIQQRQHAAEASQMQMAFGLMFARMYSPDGLMEYYRKRFAISGGLSNVNLSHDWPAKYHPDPIRAYHRISPTGPLMPIVFTPTTLGHELSICCTYRTALTSAQTAQKLMAGFEHRVREFAGRAPTHPNPA